MDAEVIFMCDSEPTAVAVSALGGAGAAAATFASSSDDDDKVGDTDEDETTIFSAFELDVLALDRMRLATRLASRRHASVVTEPEPDAAQRDVDDADIAAEADRCLVNFHKSMYSKEEACMRAESGSGGGSGSGFSSSTAAAAAVATASSTAERAAEKRQRMDILR